LLKGMMKILFERDAAGEQVIDWMFVNMHTTGIDAVRADAMAQNWDDLVRVSPVVQGVIDYVGPSDFRTFGQAGGWAPGMTTTPGIGGT